MHAGQPPRQGTGGSRRVCFGLASPLACFCFQACRKAELCLLRRPVEVHVCLMSCSCFSPRWKQQEGGRTALYQPAYSSVMNALHLYLSIDSFLHSALRLSDAALLAALQSGLLCKAVFLFLTEIIFRSITLKMPSYLSSIKLL